MSIHQGKIDFISTSYHRHKIADHILSSCTFI